MIGRLSKNHKEWNQAISILFFYKNSFPTLENEGVGHKKIICSLFCFLKKDTFRGAHKAKRMKYVGFKYFCMDRVPRKCTMF